MSKKKLPKGMQLHRCIASEVIPFRDKILRRCLIGYDRQPLLEWEVKNNLRCEFDEKGNQTFYWNDKPVVTFLDPIMQSPESHFNSKVMLYYIIHHKPAAEHVR